MGKTPDHRVFASNATLRYRRKVPVPSLDNQQESRTEAKQQLKPPHDKRERRRSSRSSTSPPGRRFRPKPQANQPPRLLKQLLWKAKSVQPADSNQEKAASSNQEEEEENDEDEEAAFATEQRQARKLLASEALAATKNKTTVATPPSEAFVAETSSQETQSGSEDEAVYLPYNDVLGSVQPQVESSWTDYKKQGDETDSAEETDGEEEDSPVMPSETVERAEVQVQGGQKQGMELELEKAADHRQQKLKPKQKYKLKQKQKRMAGKEQRRLQKLQTNVEQERSYPIGEETLAPLNKESTAVEVFHPPAKLGVEMDAGVRRAVLSQLKEVMPFIVVGDVACPVVTDSDESQPLAIADFLPSRSGVHTAHKDVAIVDFRQHVIAMLDRSKHAQVQYRDSFVEEHSGFDAAASYDFFKRRFNEVQSRSGIVYYHQTNL
ncbi:hypothetical protein PHYBOEH_007825 [Phytophthora boehmeriae]|uniref:Uncharacterized protein n=1 Tax=Phytophthora boehmeriae TaxID=109152 RepID=A0A8T1X280_9STRA|nr:hypothetical protein PHYBOEH_007825 [Phytophthora boehmeriae]